MSEELPPLPDGALKVLKALPPLEPPTGIEARVLAKLSASIASAGAGAAAGGAVATGVVTKAMVAVTVAALGAGVAGGTVLGRTVWAPEPVVVEKVRVVEVEKPAPAQAPSTEPAPPAPPPKKPAPEPSSDTLLAKEREHIDTARSALLHGDAKAAMHALDAHEKTFAKGRLAEERESLWVQALVLAGKVNDARARAAAFHRKYPNSLLGPTVDTALPP